MIRRRLRFRWIVALAYLIAPGVAYIIAAHFRFPLMLYISLTILFWVCIASIYGRDVD